MIVTPEVKGPEVAIDRQPAIVIKPPLKDDGWLINTACCKPNAHRGLRVAVDGASYAFGADVLAVADGTVVSILDGKPEATPPR